MTIELELQIASDAKTLPHPSQFKEWTSSVLSERFEEAELTIRIVDEAEMSDLNKQYRNKKGPTNVLSFPQENHPDVEITLLGDIIICAPIVEKEAIDNDKELLSHWAHMVIHGIYHLLGYDHQNDEDAKEMEELEIQTMLELGFKSPYG